MAASAPNLSPESGARVAIVRARRDRNARVTIGANGVAVECADWSVRFGGGREVAMVARAQDEDCDRGGGEGRGYSGMTRYVFV